VLEGSNWKEGGAGREKILMTHQRKVIRNNHDLERRKGKPATPCRESSNRFPPGGGERVDQKEVSLR